MKEIIDVLLNDGWREYPNSLKPYSRNFYKIFDTPTSCHCNDDINGMQVCCYVSQLDQNVVCEFELNGELDDGTWIKLHQWGLHDDVMKGLAIIPRMLATWEFIAKHGQNDLP